MKSNELSLAQARRIAIRSQLLDGSADGVLATVRRLGFLQIDPISTVAPPQRLVLWSRLGAHDSAELDRLLWEERKLFEWGAFIWPIEDFPLIRARMRRRRGKYKYEQQGTEFLRTNARFKRHLLRELEERGPLLSREIEADLMVSRDPQRLVGQPQGRAHARAARGPGCRRHRRTEEGSNASGTWPNAGTRRPRASRGPKPESCSGEALPLARRQARERQVACASRCEDGPVPRRVTFLSPFDRLIHDRDRAEALWGFRYRLEMYVPKPKREFGYYVLPILQGDRLIGRIDPALDRKTGVLHVNGVWWEPGVKPVSLQRPLRNLAAFIGAGSIEA